MDSRRWRTQCSRHRVFPRHNPIPTRTRIVHLGNHPPRPTSASRSRAASWLLRGFGRLSNSRLGGSRPTSRPTSRFLGTPDRPTRLLNFLRLGLSSLRSSSAIRSCSAPRLTRLLPLLRIECFDQRRGMCEVCLGLPRRLVQAVALPLDAVHVRKRVGVDG
jgi:hypothetical protein